MTASTNSSISSSYSRPAQPRLPPAEVQLVGAERGVVRADVEADGQRLRRMNPRRHRVERQLPDGNAHAAAPLIAQAKDALIVGDDDEANVIVRRVAQHVVNVPRSAGVIQMPRIWRKSRLNSWHACPTVGV